MRANASVKCRPLTQLVIVDAMNTGLSREDRWAYDGLEHGIVLVEHADLHYMVLQHIQARRFEVQGEHHAIVDCGWQVGKYLCVKQAPRPTMQ